MFNEKSLSKVENQPEIFPIEDWQPESFDEKFGLDIVNILKENDNLAYFAGGYPRDLVMHKLNGVEFAPHDIDITTNAKYENIKKIFDSKGIKYVEIGAEYGILKARREYGDKISEIEIATFRTEGEYEDGRRPKTDSILFIDDPKEDVSRRDLTVNALLFDPTKLAVLDYVGGIEDIKSRTLKFVGNTDERINEDRLRMMRYVRFLTRFNFKFSREAQESIRTNVNKIGSVSQERIKEELEKTLQHPSFWSTINNLYRVGLLPQIMPELARLYKLKQPKEHHAEGDAYRHTLEVLRSFNNPELLINAKEILGDDFDYIKLSKSKPNLIWAGLFHDLGKAETEDVKTDLQGNEKITFYGHEAKSEVIAQDVLRRMKFSNKDREEIAWLVGRHMSLNDFTKMRLANQKKLMLDERFECLLLLHLADSLGSWPKKLENFEKIKKIYIDFKNSSEYEKLKTNGSNNVPLFLNGYDLIGMGIKPGKLIRKIKSELEIATLEGRIKSKEEAIEFAKKIIETNNS